MCATARRAIFQVAAVCKHVAAVFYGIGARLDTQPKLLFNLRKVDGPARQGTRRAARDRGGFRWRQVLAAEGLSDTFVLDLAGVRLRPLSQPWRRRSARARRRLRPALHVAPVAQEETQYAAKLSPNKPHRHGEKTEGGPKEFADICKSHRCSEARTQIRLLQSMSRNGAGKQSVNE